jgi:uncharacterized membrane protein
MASEAVMDKVAAAAKDKGLEPEVVATNLSKEEKDQLREAFGA